MLWTIIVILVILWLLGFFGRISVKEFRKQAVGFTLCW